MRVAIDLLIADKEPGGLLFSTRALIEGMARIDRVNEYIIITARPKEYQALANSPNIRIYPVKLKSWRGILIQHQILMPELLKKIQPDILHVASYAAPVGWQGPLVMTVHDLAFLKVPEQSSLYGQLYWKYLLRESVRRAHRIIAISEQTRDELTSLWAVDKERIRLIHNALRPSLLNTEIPSQGIQTQQQRYGRRYLLHVGRIMPRKNLEQLISAFHILATPFADIHLVLAGSIGYGSNKELTLVEASPYRERIHLVGWVPEEELSFLYAGASVFVLPSKHEGFGLPQLEAMACGTPVVASYEAASRDVVGDAVLRADCSSAIPLAHAIAQVLTDEALRERLIQEGRTQIRPFTVEACAEATLRTYQEALDMNKLQVKTVDAHPPTLLTEDHPAVSVIVPVSRPEQAHQALKSLSAQQYAGKIEIIVVGTIADEVAQSWSVVPVNTGHVQEPGKARNIGESYANGDILLFLDDDCLVAKNWVDQNICALQQPGVAAVGARIRGKSSAFFARCVDFTNFGYYQHGTAKNMPVASASMAVIRTVFSKVGGFNEMMPSSEDMDLCYRIQKLGYQTIYQPDIIVCHDHRRTTFREFLRYNYTHGLKSGLRTKIQHRGSGMKNRLLYTVRFPLLFLLLLPAIALAAMLRITAMNIKENRDVLLYAPFILLGKLAYEFGVFRHLILSSSSTSGDPRAVEYHAYKPRPLAEN